MKKYSQRINISGIPNFDNLRAYQLYLEYCKLKGLSEKTLISYQSDIISWFRYLGDKTYKEIKEEDIEEFISYCKLHGNNEDRLRRRCASISSFYNFLRRKNMIDTNPLEFFDRPKKKIGVLEKHFLSKEEVLLLKKRLHKLNDLRKETYIILSLSTGARKNALINIKWSDIDFEQREIYAIEKGPQEVVLTFSNKARNMLLQLKQYYKEEKIDSQYVFITIYEGIVRQAGGNAVAEWVRKAGELIGITNLAPHSLRRTTANLLKESGVPIEDISSFLNHKDIAVTQIYVKKNLKKIKDIKDQLDI